jgi:Flp pilus assembly protein TadG
MRRNYSGCVKSPRLHNSRNTNVAARQGTAFNGQAMVEFALVLVVAMIVLFVAIQMAFIGQAALALGQTNYQAARYAAVNPTFSCSAIATYIKNNGAPTVVRKGVICADGESSCPTGGVTISAGNTNSVHACMVCSGSTTDCTKRTFGDSVQVQLAYDATQAIFLSGNKTNPNFLGIPFPTQLTSTETAMSE